jgi:hypothetical protein
VHGEIVEQETLVAEIARELIEGGPGSGHFGHKGRPGVRGGSAPGMRPTLPPGVHFSPDHPKEQRGWGWRVEEAVKNVPAGLLRKAGDVSIAVHDGDTFVKVQEGVDLSDFAVYLTTRGQIHVNEYSAAFVAKSELPEIIAHEVGHHVDYGNRKPLVEKGIQLLGPSGRYSSTREWHEIHKLEKDRISSYAAKNKPDESFAKAFSMYAVGGRLRESLAKHAQQAAAYMKTLFEENR